MSVTDKKTGCEYYGTKLFGYVQDTSNLPSCRFLINLGKCGENEIWTYSFSGDITLSEDEFREFIRLYDRDFKDYTGIPLRYVEDYEKLEAITASDGDKLLQWF